MPFEFSFSTLFMFLGFLLSAYSCVANDVIQTLGTFLSSNEKRSPWQIWAFVSVVMAVTLIYGWIINDGEMSFHRLDQIPYTGQFEWYHVLPPLALLVLTRFGMPVSTTFLLLMVFSSRVVIENMIMKSVCGYVVAFISSVIIYTIIAKRLEKHFLHKKIKNKMEWTAGLWLSTAFLWSSWIMQDVANVFVYLPRKFDFISLMITIMFFTAMLAILCYIRGGQIQKIVVNKTNTKDIRSATIINLLYGFILIFFKEINTLPMSTTWVFVGLLAGREITLYNQLKHTSSKKIWANIGKDFFKVFTGLVISVCVVYMILMLK